LLARKKAILAQLSWMTKNSMGAGAYGLNRAGGRSHDESMSRAKAVQAIFNLGSGLRDSKAARQTKDSIKSPTKTLPGKVEPRISPDQ
jgi:hypothetical protein